MHLYIYCSFLQQHLPTFFLVLLFCHCYFWRLVHLLISFIWRPQSPKVLKLKCLHKTFFEGAINENFFNITKCCRQKNNDSFVYESEGQYQNFCWELCLPNVTIIILVQQKKIFCCRAKFEIPAELIQLPIPQKVV